MPQDQFFTTLKSRARIKISGDGSADFLQGLMTNDIKLLEAQDCIYCCFLNAQGKFLYDAFITKENGAFILDCEGGERAQGLQKLLSLYRLRAKIEILLEDNVPVYAVFGHVAGYKDPRHNDMGWRSFERPESLPEKDFSEWDRRRISLCVPDGSRDLILQKSTMDEGRMDTLNAVSYDKGCYVGQELTARMHYRGLGKKHLKTVFLEGMPEGAELRSSCGDMGIALVRG